MYAWIDLSCYLLSLASIIYGICLSSGSEEILGYDEPTFYLVFGTLFYFVYPILLESIYHLLSRFQSVSIPALPSSYVPVVYHPRYNITACGIERLHPFDSCKYKRVFDFLTDSGVVLSDCLVPKICPRSLITTVHPFWYMLSLAYSLVITKMVEVPVCFIPSPLLRFRVLTPMLYATYGSVMGGIAALKKGWAINLSGGYHHCSRTSGGGFCIFADISLVIKTLRNHCNLRKFMIVDLDAHQGNGHENDFIGDEDVFIIDFYNPYIYPGDTHAKQAIRYEERIEPMTDDRTYIGKLERALNTVEEFKPDFILYNAGTDCMQGDPLGGMNISPQGIVRRDETVFRCALEKRVPILMVLSGGYQQSNARVIADSIQNLSKEFNLLYTDT